MDVSLLAPQPAILMSEGDVLSYMSYNTIYYVYKQLYSFSIIFNPS